MAGISAELGLKRSFGRQEIYDKLLRMFLEMRAATADEIESAIAKGEIDSASMIAHSIKSSAGTLGAENLAATAAALEQALNEGKRDAWPDLQQAFAQELARVVEGLRVHFGLPR